MNSSINANDRQVGGDHYKTGGVELWDLFGPESIIFYATRYLQRWRKKDGVRDLEKALHCVQKLREIVPHHTMRNVLTVDDSLFESWLSNAVDGADERAIIRRIVIWYKSDSELEYAAAGIQYLIRKGTSEDIVNAKLSDGTKSDKLLGKMTGPNGPPRVERVTVKSPSKHPRDMSNEELVVGIADYDKKITEYPHWGAALTAMDEGRKELLDEKARRQRRVPRYAGLAPVIGNTPSYTHAPWVASKDYMTNTVDHECHDTFYKRYGADIYVLEPHVITEDGTIPIALQPYYDAYMEGWVLAIRKCPKEARDYFPNLIESMHKKQWEDETPEWQRVLYTWSVEKSKYELTDMTAAWHVEPEDK